MTGSDRSFKVKGTQTYQKFQNKGIPNVQKSQKKELELNNNAKEYQDKATKINKKITNKKLKEHSATGTYNRIIIMQRDSVASQ